MILSWSFSRRSIFEQCAYRAKLAWIDKIPDNTPRTAADRGTEIHTEAENYVQGSDPLHTSLRHFADDFASLRTHYADGRVLLEQEWGFSRDWDVAPWQSAWLRLKCDAVVNLSETDLVVIDFKTGRRFGNEVSHLDQLILYAVTSFVRYPGIQKVITEDWYLDQNEKTSHEMTRKQMPRHLAQQDKRGRAMTDAKTFKPNPNMFTCKWCPYGPDKQGDCKFGVSSIPQPKAVVKPLVFTNKPSKSDALF